MISLIIYSDIIIKNLTELVMKVLIVDDSLIIRRSIENWLGDMDLEIADTASNGKEAVEKVASIKPDIVTLDITMPEMDGLTALEEILKIEPSTNVIIISALADKETALAAIKNGAVSFLLKPFNKEELQEVFQEVIEEGK